VSLKKPELRAATESDAELLADIHRQCFPNYWDIDAFNNFFAVENTFALLAENRAPAGMTVYRVQYEQADIITLAVCPNARRQGIARLLLKEALSHMAGLGVKQLFLDVEAGNLPALSLYEGHGFTHIKRRRNYYRQKDGTFTDALVMSYKFA
jgi:[ribosomal protein S18]-alanine N-acetyltransferase